MTKQYRLAVLASGRGTNFETIARACASGEIPHTSVVKLITHNPNAEALSRAKALSIETVTLTGHESREKYEAALLAELQSLRPDFICLAGYLRLLPASIVRAFPNQILNVHPSLLPSFPGLHSQKQALDHGARLTGCTVHFVTEDLDAGPILAQSTVLIEEGDTEDTLSARLLPIEHATYIAALKRLVTEPFRVDGRRVNFKKN